MYLAVFASDVSARRWQVATYNCMNNTYTINILVVCQLLNILWLLDIINYRTFPHLPYNFDGRHNLLSFCMHHIIMNTNVETILFPSPKIFK